MGESLGFMLRLKLSSALSAAYLVEMPWNSLRTQNFGTHELALRWNFKSPEVVMNNRFFDDGSSKDCKTGGLVWCLLIASAVTAQMSCLPKMVERKLAEEAKEAEKLFRLRKRSRGIKRCPMPFMRGRWRTVSCARTWPIQRCGCLKVESSVREVWQSPRRCGFD